MSYTGVILRYHLTYFERELHLSMLSADHHFTLYDWCKANIVCIWIAYRMDYIQTLLTLTVGVNFSQIILWWIIWLPKNMQICIYGGSSLALLKKGSLHWQVFVYVKRDKCLLGLTFCLFTPWGIHTQKQTYVNTVDVMFFWTIHICILMLLKWGWQSFVICSFFVENFCVYNSELLHKILTVYMTK